MGQQDTTPGVSAVDLRDVLYALGIEPNDVDRLINRGLERGRIFLGRELRIVASAATPPARDEGDGVEVRVAIAADITGNMWAEIINPDVPEYVAWRLLDDGGHSQRVAIITARVPKPQAPTIPAAVQEAER